MEDSGQAPNDGSGSGPWDECEHKPFYRTPIQETLMRGRGAVQADQFAFPWYDPQVLEDVSTHSLAYLEGPAPQQSGENEPSQSASGPSRYFEGLCSNAERLGISRSDILRVDALSYFSTSSLDEWSPYDTPESLIPTAIQRRFPHHPFFDCIPIPALRDRLILACSTVPPVVNRFDICYDMFAGGLTFQDDPSIEANWRYSPEFERKWRALIQMDTSIMLRHVESTQVAAQTHPESR